MNFNTLKKNLKKDFTGLKPVKVALLGDSATQFLGMALRGQGFEAGLNIDLYEADYDLIYETIIDSNDKLYKDNYEYIFIFQSTQKLLHKFYELSPNEKTEFATTQKAYIENLVSIIKKQSSAKVILFNFVEINDSVFGNLATKTPSAFLFQLRKLNVALQDIAAENKNVFIADVLSAVNSYGSNAACPAKWFITSQNVFQLDFLPIVAKTCVDILAAFAGKIKKCLVLDLDNTTWGGIIGDDGIENIQVGDLGIGKAFSELQYWAKELKNRGVLLAICSKNDEHIAKEVFEKHPDMILRLEDISIFVANWSNKGDNILYIQQSLNIGMDSLVFVDDNPFERNMIKTMHPDVTVPDLPEDPAEYLPFLRSLNLFETVSFTDEDTVRTKQYQEESHRAVLQQSFESVDEYLASLQMEAKVEDITPFNLARCAQLTQRSNQFNVTTIRYSEEQLTIFIKNGGVAKAISLKDKFGDYGMISLVLLEKQNDVLEVNTWVMSCRVLKRGVEEFAVNEIINTALQMNSNEIHGKYIPTPKNGMVSKLFENMGFEKINDQLSILKRANFAALKTNVKKEQ